MKLHVFYYADDGSIEPGVALDSFDEAIEYIEVIRRRANHVPDDEPELTEKEHAEQEKSSHLHP